MDAREDGLLMSGIQHFAFCRRQWALIHIEQQWQENARTAQGQLDHVRCHDETLSEKRDNVFTVRGMRVFSRKLNLSGACDVVEFHKDKNGISLEGQPGFWLPYPVEYKHGREKETDADRLQLCAEAMALEEMLVCDIPAGALYYIETRRREVVPFTDENGRPRCRNEPLFHPRLHTKSQTRQALQRLLVKIDLSAGTVQPCRPRLIPARPHF